MDSATIAELRNRLSAYLHRVEAGERILVRRRGRAIAELRPISPAHRQGDKAQVLAERLDSLERNGFLSRGSDRWPEWTKGPIPGEPAPLLQALLDERESGR